MLASNLVGDLVGNEGAVHWHQNTDSAVDYGDDDSKDDEVKGRRVSRVSLLMPGVSASVRKLRGSFRGASLQSLEGYGDSLPRGSSQEGDGDDVSDLMAARDARRLEEEQIEREERADAWIQTVFQESLRCSLQAQIEERARDMMHNQVPQLKERRKREAAALELQRVHWGNQTRKDIINQTKGPHHHKAAGNKGNRPGSADRERFRHFLSVSVCVCVSSVTDSPPFTLHKGASPREKGTHKRPKRHTNAAENTKNAARASATSRLLCLPLLPLATSIKPRPFLKLPRKRRRTLKYGVQVTRRISMSTREKRCQMNLTLNL